MPSIAGHYPRLILLIAGFVVVLAAAVGARLQNQPPSRAASADSSAALQTNFAESCLKPGASNPLWECYELTVNLPPGEPIVVRHAASGETHRTSTFRAGSGSRFRFTPSRTGTWSFSSGDDIQINAQRPAYAKGFLGAAGRSWQRTATGETVVPQYVMYDGADLDEALREFVTEHGFSGFHITNLRDFLVNPSYFEAVVLKTYRLGGTTHFWLWGDAARRQTPQTYGVDVARLYREIAARLGPIPGWSVGFGFDLHEWASAEQVQTFRDRLNETTSYRHMVGARGYKNQYRQISEDVDYASWEWHQPSYDDYVDHLRHSNGMPAFSEDRFRIREPSRYPEKDYDAQATLAGLWESTLAGGVANIWGFKPSGASYSQAYPNKQAIRTYRTFVDRYYERPVARSDVVEGAKCLETASRHLCLVRGVEDFEVHTERCRIIAVDADGPYEEREMTESANKPGLPYESAWALVVEKPGSADCH